MGGAICHTCSESEVSRDVTPGPPDHLRLLGTSRVVKLQGPDLSIGSARRNQLVLADRYVSRKHCRIILRPDGVWVEDLLSRNGTWVNNIKVQRCRLHAGARIMIGRSTLQLMGPAARPCPRGIIGEHDTMQQMFDLIERYGATLRPALIIGETGTGKELVAQALHDSSPCRHGPFEPVNCSTIPRDLAETELFGHAKGAFTGATQERRGAFERADGGTLFLDEIGEMPLGLQPKLLRVLEDGRVLRLGEEQPRPVNVRIVSATHRDLRQAAARSNFRLDLYHRLAVGIVEVPALRQRADDIPLLVDHFLRLCGSPGHCHSVDPDAMAMLARHPWPGNVRELRNVLERAAAGRGPRLGLEDFVLDDVTHVTGRVRSTVQIEGRLFDDIKRDVFTSAVAGQGGNLSAAASVLGIPKSTFYDQVRSLKIKS